MDRHFELEDFIGPPVGWYGRVEKVINHPALVGRPVSVRYVLSMGGESFVEIYGIGKNVEESNFYRE